MINVSPTAIRGIIIHPRERERERVKVEKLLFPFDSLGICSLSRRSLVNRDSPTMNLIKRSETERIFILNTSLKTSNGNIFNEIPRIFTSCHHETILQILQNFNSTN